MGGKRSTAQKLTHDGKTLSIDEWSKETGLPSATIRDRINKENWSVSTALTVPPDTSKNRASTLGQQIRENVRVSFDKVWTEVGQVEFEKQLKVAFKEDALKTVERFASFLPKDAVERSVSNQEKAVVRIEFNQVSTDPPTIVMGGA